VKQIEIHTAQVLLPHPSPFQVQITVVKPGIDQIPAENTQAGCSTFLRSINL
jgi:hypothetical protein